MTRTQFKKVAGAQHALVDLHQVEVKSQGEEMFFTGYGAVFGNIDSYYDIIEKGAFTDSLEEAKQTGRWPSMMSQHDYYSNPIGVWTNMYEDDYGLKVEGILAETPAGIETYNLLKMKPRPAINGLSIGYRTVESSADVVDGVGVTRLKKLDLWEVSLVTFPANPESRVSGVKNGLTLRDAERALREAGFSRNEAKTIVSSGFNTVSDLRDVGTSGGGDLTESLRDLLTRIA